ncbi:hypothetical protein [Pseudomonas sp. MYb185]|uniref:hypothetical protein n=1 Tax=Pseudomonas sp. MYb185 TaxID=1848729 RepID=UPI0011B04E48|nr:hypothetical protein [Pseudomonas sp. MYb185]
MSFAKASWHRRIPARRVPAWGLMLLAATALMACESSSHPYGLYSEKVPVCFSTSAGFECEGEAENRLLIAPAASGQALVDLDMVFTNGHSCTAENAPGQWAEGHLVVTVDSGTDACEFTISFSGKEATLADDPDTPCRERICGARGMLDGMVLPFKGEPADDKGRTGGVNDA